MSPSESLPLALNEVSDSVPTPAWPEEPSCVGCRLNRVCCRCPHNPDLVSKIQEDFAQEVLSHSVPLSNISTAREVRAYDHNRRQAMKATKLDKSRQRKQAARLLVKLNGGPGLNRKVRKETGAAGVKRVRGRSVANFLLEDGVGVFEDEYLPTADVTSEEEGSLYEYNCSAPHWSSCNSGSSDDISESDSQSTPSEFDSEPEDRICPPYRSWRPSNTEHCSTYSTYDDSTDDLTRNMIRRYGDGGIAQNVDSTSSEPTRGDNPMREDERGDRENLLLPQLNLPPLNISSNREVRAYEYIRDQVKSKAEFGRLRERKQSGRIVKSNRPKPKGRKQSRLLVAGLDLDTSEDLEEESTIPLEVSLSSILSEEPSSRPFDLSDLVQTVKVKKGREPEFEFVPNVRVVIALDDPVQELDFEDSQWEQIWNDDLLDEPLSYVHPASF